VQPAAGEEGHHEREDAVDERGDPVVEREEERQRSGSAGSTGLPLIVIVVAPGLPTPSAVRTLTIVIAQTATFSSQ